MHQSDNYELLAVTPHIILQSLLQIFVIYCSIVEREFVIGYWNWWIDGWETYFFHISLNM